ncbi:MAG: hypothetical protein ABI780_01845 [Ardenticatenales bacterium]
MGRDVVVTVPKGVWLEWLAEGDLSGDPSTGQSYVFSTIGRPESSRGDRCYVVAHGRLRGFAPLIDVCRFDDGVVGLVRAGGAVAVTIPEPIIGFRGWRYRWWDRADEVPFPDWMTADVDSSISRALQPRLPS